MSVVLYQAPVVNDELSEGHTCPVILNMERLSVSNKPLHVLVETNCLHMEAVHVLTESLSVVLERFRVVPEWLSIAIEPFHEPMETTYSLMERFHVPMEVLSVVVKGFSVVPEALSVENKLLCYRFILKAQTTEVSLKDFGCFIPERKLVKWRTL